MSSNSTLNNSVLSTARVSIDEGDNLNDDLAVESEVSSFVSQPGPNSNPNTHRRSESAISFRNSIDVESSFSSVLQFNPDESFNVNDELSPLGPNSIYALTVGSDNARAKRNRAPKSSVTINGGLTTINNLKYPTYKDIPQIQLHKLKHKIKNEQITSKYVKNSLQEYKSFESSYNNLTEDSLQQFSQKKGFKDDDQLSTSSSIDQFQYKESDDINAIPSVFLDQNFRLDDPRIFKQVMEDSTILYDNELVNNNALQEKFSHYLDIVEVNLIKEISKTSDSFFSTIGDIQIMKEESDECVEQFKLIKSKLDKLGEEHAHLGNKILEKLAEQRNVEYLESSIIQLKYIISIFELANKSYNNAKYNKCLTEIVVVENLIRGVSYDQLTDEEVGSFYPKFDYPLVNLSNLPALVYLQNDLQNLKEECSKGYINDFIQILLGDLRDHYNSVSTGDTLNRIYNSIDKQKKYQSRTVNTSYSTVKDEKKTKLIDYVKNLGKAGKLTQAYSLYQEKIITEIKDIIKNNLPNASNQNGNYLSVDLSNAPSRSSSDPPESANSSQAQPVSNTLSSNIKSLTPREFETMFIKIYCNLSECLRRLTAHQKLLLDIALTNVSPDVTRNIDIMALDISMAINRAIELTQIRLTKVINVRSEQTADIPVPYYLRLYSISSAYLQECELISPGYVAPGGGNSLSDWFKHHILYFVHRFHSNSLKKLISDCDRETWKEIVQSDILEKYQSILDEITGYATFLSSAGAEGFSGSKWMDLFDFYDYGKIESPHKGSVSGDRTRLATGKESFMIPNLTLVALEAIRDYLIISKAFPNTTSIIETNILNYFKLMNSKTSQAVLNAGATRTAGLKHITTKHLALCIQVVEFNIALLPNVQLVFAKKETSPVQRDPNQSDELTFYRIISNYKDHENEIFSKLVSIMHDRTLSHCNAIIGIDWSQPLTHPRQCHQYMETLVKDTTTVAKVLSRYLAEIKCSLILSQIFDNYKRLLVECYCTKLKQFKDFNEKQMVLKDIDFFRVKLCELPGYGNSGQVIWENVNSLPTEEDTKMAEIMRKNIEGEIKSNVESAGNSKKNSLDIPATAKETQDEEKPDAKEKPLPIPEVEKEEEESKDDLEAVEEPKGEEPIEEKLAEESNTVVLPQITKLDTDEVEASQHEEEIQLSKSEDLIVSDENNDKENVQNSEPKVKVEESQNNGIKESNGKHAENGSSKKLEIENSTSVNSKEVGSNVESKNENSILVESNQSETKPEAINNEEHNIDESKEDDSKVAGSKEDEPKEEEPKEDSPKEEHKEDEPAEDETTGIKKEESKEEEESKADLSKADHSKESQVDEVAASESKEAVELPDTAAAEDEVNGTKTNGTDVNAESIKDSGESVVTQQDTSNDVEKKIEGTEE